MNSFNHAEVKMYIIEIASAWKTGNEESQKEF